MSRGRRLGLASVLVCPVTLLPGCYSILGVRHDYDVAKELTPGLTRAEALCVLADGARISLDAEIPKPDTGEWPEKIYAPGVREALERSEETTKKTVVLILRVDRSWGFSGLGVFHLFMSQEDRLLGFHLFHIN